MFAWIDLRVHLVVRLARARGAGGGVRVAEVHPERVRVGIARVGPLVVGVRPLGRIGIRRRLVQDVVHVPLGRGLALLNAWRQAMASEATAREERGPVTGVEPQARSESDVSADRTGYVQGLGEPGQASASAEER